MKIIINTAGNLGGGGLQVALSFINECKNIGENRYYVFLGLNAVPQINKSEFPSNFLFYDIPSMKFYKLNGYLKRLEAEIIPDVVFSVFGPSYFTPEVPHLVGFAQGYYIYDDSPFWETLSWLNFIKLKLKKWIHLKYFQHEATALVCETEDATQRVRKIFGQTKKYFTVSNTFGNQYTDEKLFYLPDKLPPRKKDEFRFLTLCKYYPHKNIQIIPIILDMMFEKGVKNIRFVLTITREEYATLFGDKYMDSVINVGGVPVNECPSLYRECDAMFLPTTLECFSASYPEAMIMNKPIVTTDISFAHSICRDAALYVDIRDLNDIAEKLIALSCDKKYQEELIVKGNDRVKVFPTAIQRANSYLQILRSISLDIT